MTSTKEKKKQANNRKFDNLKEKIKNTLKNMKMKKSKKIFLANSKIMRLFVFPNQYVVRQMLNNWICQQTWNNYSRLTDIFFNFGWAPFPPSHPLTSAQRTICKWTDQNDAQLQILLCLFCCWQTLYLTQRLKHVYLIFVILLHHCFLGQLTGDPVDWGNQLTEGTSGLGRLPTSWLKGLVDCQD